jgi:hypothetical protein
VLVILAFLSIAPKRFSGALDPVQVPGAEPVPGNLFYLNWSQLASARFNGCQALLNSA